MKMAAADQYANALVGKLRGEKAPVPPSATVGRAALSFLLAEQRHCKDVAMKDHDVVDEALDVADGLAPMDLGSLAHQHQTFARINRIAKADVLQAAEAHEIAA